MHRTLLMLLVFLIPSLALAAPPIEVQGHRGARALRPENTIPAFLYALDLGVDTLELDLQVTKDRRLVVGHDPHVTKGLCLDAAGKPLAADLAIRTLTLAQVQAYDCGSLPQPRFPRQVAVPRTPMPSLLDVFAAVAASPSPHAKKVKFNIEMKIVPRFAELSIPPGEFAALVLDDLHKARVVSRVTLQSFDHRALRAAKALAPKLPIALLIGDELPDWGALVAAEHAQVVSPHMDWVSAGAVKNVHRRGAKVIAWTANSEADWQYLISCGVDGIISDDPAALIAYLKRIGRR